MTPKKQWIWFHKPLFLSILLFFHSICPENLGDQSSTSLPSDLLPIIRPIIAKQQKSTGLTVLQKRFLVLLETMTTLNFDEDEVDLESNTEVPFSIIE